MGERTCGEYDLIERLPGSGGALERWSARGPRGPAELVLGGAALLKRARPLPSWGPFPRLDWGQDQGQAYVVVPGQLLEDLHALGRRLSPGSALAFAWHLAACVAELHETGAAHGALDPRHAGLDAQGRLCIRPALASPGDVDPDPAATAQATDCLALGRMLDALRVELVDDPAVTLMMRGLRREQARLRLQPGRSVRQAIAAILARNPEFEQSLVDTLGPGWRMGRLPQAPPPIRPRPTGAAPWERPEDTDEEALDELPPPHAGEAARVFVGNSPPPAPRVAPALVAVGGGAALVGGPAAHEDEDDDDSLDGPFVPDPQPGAARAAAMAAVARGAQRAAVPGGDAAGAEVIEAAEAQHGEAAEVIEAAEAGEAEAAEVIEAAEAGEAEAAEAAKVIEAGEDEHGEAAGAAKVIEAGEAEAAEVIEAAQAEHGEAAEAERDEAAPSATTAEIEGAQAEPGEAEHGEAAEAIEPAEAEPADAAPAATAAEPEHTLAEPADAAPAATAAEPEHTLAEPADAAESQPTAAAPVAEPAAIEGAQAEPREATEAGAPAAPDAAQAALDAAPDADAAQAAPDADAAQAAPDTDAAQAATATSATATSATATSATATSATATAAPAVESDEAELAASGEEVEDAGTAQTALPGRAVEEDTAVQPLRAEVAAEIEAEPELGDGEYFAAGRGAPITVDAMPDLPDVAPPGEPLAPPPPPPAVVPQPELLTLDEAPRGEATEDDATYDTTLVGVSAEGTEDPSSVLAGPATVHDAREVLPDPAAEGAVLAVDRAEQPPDRAPPPPDPAPAAPPAAAPPPPGPVMPPPSLAATPAALGPLPPSSLSAPPAPSATPPAPAIPPLAAPHPPAAAATPRAPAPPRAEPDPAGTDRAGVDRAGVDRADADRLDAGDRLGEAPRWAGVRGVTGDSSREAELGRGKWTEEARPMEQVARDLGDAPVRELDLGRDEGSHGPLYAVLGLAALAVLAFIGWRVLGSDEPTPAEPAAVATAAPASVAVAAPTSITVTVTTAPGGGRVFLDGRDLGVEPAVVPVPLDAATHELCVERAGQRSCRMLTGEALAASDPYVYALE